MISNAVVVTDIRMPFASMVEFMVKWAIASIPAFFILALLGALVVGIIRMLDGAFWPGLR